MSAQLGTAEQPLRVAIIGSGPSAFYAAEHIQKQSDLVATIDMFERLPTPHGLVRGGVAPDHPKIKSVTKIYDRIAGKPGFRFFGNVELGKDIHLSDLRRLYHQIVYAVGAQTDRRMGIPGEDLLGSHPATEFVGWYNAHPDFRDLSFDLSQERAAVIGNGNVAMDVARILASSHDELAVTDIADYALEALRNSNIKEIYVLGRRGPAQAAFTNPEIKELGALSEADVIVPADEAALDPLSEAWLEANGDRSAQNNVKILQSYADEGPDGKPRRIVMRFLVSPVEIIGTERVEAIKIVKNELYQRDDGSLRPRATEVTETLPVGLVFRSIGYRGVALADVPFDDRNGVIPNQEGRVIDSERDGALTPGEYCVGWIKRGPSGVIGTNKPDSVETVERMLEDVAAGQTLTPAAPQPEAVNRLMAERTIDFVSYPDWLLLDAFEQERGEPLNRPRVKFSTVPEMLDAIRSRREANPTGD
ncbi:MAG: FAD-dependent oxidoreductase [Chloroflexi bacterium]|nr:FAD-dependent oxidoreductase [Chloroflexota bacterium]